MASVEVTGIPDGYTVTQGYFVWSGIDEEGYRVSGGVEYPFNLDEEPEHHDYDGQKVIGMLTVARHLLIENEMDSRRMGNGDEED